MSGNAAQPSEPAAGSPVEESLEEANARLDLVNRIALAVGSSRTIEQVIDLGVRNLAGAFPGVRVSYSTVDADNRVEVVRSIDPPGMPRHESASWDLGGAAEYLGAIRRQEIVVCDDVGKDPRMAPLASIMEESGVSALVTAALPHASGKAGLLSFNAPKPRRWSQHEIATLTESAAHLFLAIQEARHERDRVAAEESLRHRAELEELLVRLSTNFINMPPARIEQALGEVLPELARAAAAEAVLVFLFSEDRRQLVRRFEWLDPSLGGEVDRPSELATWELPGLMSSLAKLEPFRASAREELPPEAQEERKHFEHFGLRSLLGIPIATRGELLGFVGLVQLREDKGWRDEAVAVLRVVGDIFGGALDRKRSAESLELARAQLVAGNRELERSNRAMTLLNELGDLLQSCASFQEAGGVFDDFLPQLFAGSPGAVYLSSSSSPLLDVVARWGDLPADESPFGAEDCWALRRGRPHVVEAGDGGLLCPHVGEPTCRGTVCVPLMAQGQALGMLHVRGGDEDLGGDALRLVLSAAEHLALGLANLRLRERLRSQRLRDPVTGLVNRAYLEEQLAREEHRARRLGLPLTLMALVPDAVEEISTQDAGERAAERLLAALGQLLLQVRPPESLAARLEGATVAVLLPEHDTEDARKIAETLMAETLRATISVGHELLKLGTLSVGVATLTGSEVDAARLLSAAAGALSLAKSRGGGEIVEAPVSSRRAPALHSVNSFANR